jgi:hypothetical protein
VNPVPDPLLLRKSGSAGNRAWDLWLAAKNSDYKTTEAVGSCSTATKNYIMKNGEEKRFTLLSAQDKITYITIRKYKL